jgi:hypothetical protein
MPGSKRITTDSSFVFGDASRACAIVFRRYLERSIADEFAEESELETFMHEHEHEHDASNGG